MNGMGRRTFSPFWLLLVVTALLAGCSAEGEGKPDAEQAKEAETAASVEKAGGEKAGGASAPADAGGEAPEEAPDPGDVGANEAGLVMVLEYHRVGGDPYFAPEWTISTAELRRELEYLHENDYFPVNFRDLLRGTMDVPTGKTPVVLTFDDSSDTQFTMVRENGEWVPDPRGAVGVLTDFHRRHQDWPLRATFFVLPAADAPNDLFGQPALEEEKLRFLTENGMEVGTHTLWHADLAISTPAQVREQLALSVVEINERLPDYEVVSLSVPFGSYPQNVNLLRSGNWQGHSYELEGAADVAGGASYPPWDSRFDPYRVPRIQTGTLESQSQGMFRYFEAYPEERYVSDGDPQTVSFPEGAGARLDPRALDEAGKTPHEYRKSPTRR